MVLQLMATDDYGSGRNGTTTVHVSLSNVNDHPPAFLQPHYDLNVTENVALRHVVTTFNATDRDNDYSFLMFYIYPPGAEGRFYLNPMSGQFCVSVCVRSVLSGQFCVSVCVRSVPSQFLCQVSSA